MTERWQPKTWDVSTSDLSDQLQAAAREKALEGLTSIIAWGLAQEAATTLKPLADEAEQAAQSKERELADTNALVAKRQAYKLRDQVRPLRQEADQLSANLRVLQAVECPAEDALPGLWEWLELRSG